MIKHLIRYTRRFFSFNYAEAKGFLVMAAGILMAAICYLFYNQLPPEGYTTYAGDKATLDSLVMLIESRRLTTPEGAKGGKPALDEGREKVFTYFTFNPNQLSVDSLQLLGIPDWLAQRMDNYRKKGGVFRKKEDLLKIYGLSEHLYARLEPHIILPTPVPHKKQDKASEKSRSRTAEKLREKPAVAIPENSININQADSLELQQLQGIGPVLSSRIIRFRDKMGGFVHFRQLNEVYGLDSTVVNLLKKVAFIEPDFQPTKIALNTADRQTMAAHPYISPVQARLIVQYREQHGSFTSVDDLRRIHTLTTEFVNKIAPYIRLD